MSRATRGCFLCGCADFIEPTTRALHYPGGEHRPFAIACGACGVLSRDEAAARDPANWSALAGSLSGTRYRPDRSAPFGLDLFTLRTAATRLRRRAEPVDTQQAQALAAPHSERAAEAILADLADGPARSVALGILCRAAELDAVLIALPVHAAWAHEAIVLCDGPQQPVQGVAVAGFEQGAVRVAHRPLGSDFSAQRNALTALSAAPWMLQLDADEHLSEGLGALLPALAALADQGGAVSVGLPRRNHVDGQLSALYPDVQYRLNRRDVAYAGRVHERPERPWQRSFIALCGTIEHHITGAHARTRSQTYEALAPGGGRLHEAEALFERL